MPRRRSWSFWSPASLPRMKTLLALLIACLALTLAACGGDDDNEGSDSGGDAPAATEQKDDAAQKPAASGETVTVDMKNIKFVPENVTVKAGTTVKWTNSDTPPHTVTKSDGPGADFDSGSIDPGGTFEQTFEDKGTIDYVCTIHPGQKGSITVE